MFTTVEINLHTLQPLTFTHHGVQGLPLMARGVDAQGQHLQTVYVPASQFRGRIRHEAAIAEFKRTGGKVSLEHAYLFALGQDLEPKAEKADEAIRLQDQVELRASKPFLDLFGTWKLSSRLFVGHLLPQANVSPAKVSHIRRDLDTNAELMGALDATEHERFFDRQDAQSKASKAKGQIDVAQRARNKARKDKNETLAAEIDDKIEKLKQSVEATKGDDQSDNTKHLVTLEVIPSGLDLLGSLRIQHCVPQDVRYLVDALHGLSRAPYMGAQRARGCGEVKGEARFVAPDGDVLLTAELGGHRDARVAWTQAGHAFMQVTATAA